MTVNVASLKVRSGPGLTYDTIGAVTKNDKLDVIGKENDWLQINFGSTTGWVASWYTTKESLELTNKQIISKVNQLNVRTEPSLLPQLLVNYKKVIQLMPINHKEIGLK